MGERLIFDKSTEKFLGQRMFLVFDLTDPKKRFLRINKKASIFLRLNEGRGIRFMKMDDEWYIGSTTSSDGYKARRSNTEMYHVSCAIVIEEILGITSYKNVSVKYMLRPTKVEWDGNPVLFIDKTVRLSANKKTG